MSTSLLKAEEITEFEKELSARADPKAQSDYILGHGKVLDYLTNSLDDPVEKQMQDIKDDKYKALAHAAYLYQNPPSNVDLHNHALEFISAHHNSASMENFKKSGDSEKFSSSTPHSSFSLSNFKITAKAGDVEKFEKEGEEEEGEVEECEHCTCEQGPLTHVPSALKETVFIPQSLNEQFSGLNLKDTKYLASADGGLGMYAQTHEFKIDTSQ
jgi:hypothetical protein